MILKEIVEKLNIKNIYTANEEQVIEKGYCCDLMSEVIGRADSNSIWVTVHNNMNVLGVAVMIDIKGVIITEGHEITDEFLAKAKEEGISVYSTEENSFNIAGQLYELGLR